MRIPGLGGKVVTKAGGSAVLAPAGELYTDLERGVIDALEWTIAQLELLTLGDYQPDCTFILDLPVEAGLKRAENVGEKDRFESEESAFFNRVRQAFLARAHASSRSHIINAGEPLATVQSEIKQVLTPILEEFL